MIPPHLIPTCGSLTYLGIIDTKVSHSNLLKETDRNVPKLIWHHFGKKTLNISALFRGNFSEGGCTPNVPQLNLLYPTYSVLGYIPSFVILPILSLFLFHLLSIVLMTVMHKLYRKFTGRNLYLLTGGPRNPLRNFKRCAAVPMTGQEPYDRSGTFRNLWEGLPVALECSRTPY